MTEAARIVQTCHHARMLLFDIALRNFVIAEDGTLRAIDFAQSAVLPMETDMPQANADGLTVKVGIIHLGSVIYSLAIWSRREMDCDHEEQWPSLQGFFDTTGIPWAFLIRGCWERRFVSVDHLLKFGNRARASKRLNRRCLYV